MRVYQQLIEQYGFTGARLEFYTVWTDCSNGDFSKWLTRAYLEDVNEHYANGGNMFDAGG